MSADAGFRPASERTPLYALHVALGAKMVPFAGYEMPVQYPLGILKEHLHTRAQAGLFDVSHMGQALLIGPDHATTASRSKALVPADIVNLKPGQQRYTQLLNDDGGIIDDLMVTRRPGRRRRPAVPGRQRRAQGRRLRAHRRAPAATRDGSSRRPSARCWPCRGRPAAQMPGIVCPEAARALPSWQRRQRPHRRARLPHLALGLHRRGRLRDLGAGGQGARPCGEMLLAPTSVQPIGLGARDSLRLEAGLASTATTSTRPPAPSRPASPGRSRSGAASEGGFPGASASRTSWPNGPKRRRVGIRPDGRAPAREGTEIRRRPASASASSPRAASGPASTARSPWATSQAGHAEPGTPVNLMVRGKALPASSPRCRSSPLATRRKS